MPDEKKEAEGQKVAEAKVESFRKNLGPFVRATETTRMAMVFTNARKTGSPIIFANDSFLSLTGYDRREVLGRDFNFLMARGADPEALAELEIAFKGGSNSDPEIRYRRRDGTVFWATVFISPVRDKSGAIAQHFASFMDVTKRRQEVDRLQFFLDELNHRTRDMLTTVQAIAGQTLRGVADEAVVEAFESRIMALAKIHGLLGRENWEGVGLSDVTDQILRPFGLNGSKAARFSLKGEGGDILLKPKAALSLGMVLHELASNAAKYGALSNAAGRIDISWRSEPAPQGNRMRLHWRENGGPPVTPAFRKGFGTLLIEDMAARELDGGVGLDYEPMGVVCRIVMPISGEGSEP